MARGVPTGVLLGVVALCVLAGVGTAAYGTSHSPVDASPTFEGYRTVALAADESTSLQSDSTIRLTQELRLTPDRPGEYEAVHRYEIPNEVTFVNTTLQDRVSVVETDGFTQVGPRTYEWDGSTGTPSLTLRVAANETAAGTGPIGTGGEYRFVDVGEWAIVTRPQAGHSWRWRSRNEEDEVGFERAATVTGEGAVGGVIAFLGSQETYTETAHGQTARLVVPEAATLAADREEIFDSLFDAADSLRVGDRDANVFVVAAPSESVDWGVRGVQVGDADAWVLDEETLDEPDNVWLHEYVHTRQDFATDESARWLNEGTATYYAARLSLEQERIDFATFREYLERGTRTRHDGAVLADPTTWETDPQYAVGPLVTGELDRRTRLATDSGSSFDRVFARLNDQEDGVSSTDLVGHLETVAGSEVADAGRRYTTTTERPSTWDATQHGAAFGVTPARFTYAFASGADETDAPFAVTGPYRNASFGSEDSLAVVTGETLSFAVSVTNTGGAAGDYEVTPSVDGASIGSASGRIAPNESATHAFDHRFDAPGQRTLTVGDEAIVVRVRDPSVPTVTDFRADRTRLQPGQSVTLSIDVGNEADWPAGGTIPVTQNGREVRSNAVALDAGARTTLTVERRLDAPGKYTFGLGDASDRIVTVVVEEPFPTTIALAAGGAAVVLLVALTAFGWWRRRSRRRRRTNGHDPWG